MKKLCSIIIFATLNFFVLAQDMARIKYKRLKAEEAKHYIKKYNGFKKQHPSISWTYLYECDSNVLVLENTKENRYTLYYDRAKYYQEMEKTARLINERPLSKQQGIIKDIENQKAELLNSLFKDLNLVKPAKLNLVELKELDKKIKLYGYEEAYFNLLLNMLVFCGEYIREQKGGHWTVVSDAGNQGEVEPIFIDDNGKKYGFWINTLLIKGYMENEKISISDVISSALMPEIFKVIPNPTMRDPNE